MTKKTGAALTCREVEDRLQEAASTFRRLPMKDGPKEFGSSWSEYVREAKHAYGYHKATMKVRPSPEQISRMDEVIGWLRLIESKDERRDAFAWRIFWMRTDGYRWIQIGRRVGLSSLQTWRIRTVAVLTIEKRLRTVSRQTRKRGRRSRCPFDVRARFFEAGLQHLGRTLDGQGERGSAQRVGVAAYARYRNEAAEIAAGDAHSSNRIRARVLPGHQAHAGGVVA